MPTFLYLTAHLNAKQARLLRSNFLAYKTSLGLSGGCKQGYSRSDLGSRDIYENINPFETFLFNCASSSTFIYGSQLKSSQPG